MKECPYWGDSNDRRELKPKEGIVRAFDIGVSETDRKNIGQVCRGCRKTADSRHLE